MSRHADATAAAGEIPRTATAVVLAMVSAVAALGLAVGTHGDASVLSFFTTHRHGWTVDLAKAATLAGDIRVLFALAAIATIVAWIRLKSVLAAAPTLAFLTAGVITAIGKSAIGRARPPLYLHLVSETEPSMPSGHTADGTAFYVALALVVAFALRRPLWSWITAVITVVLCVSIGLSRLELGVHWPTDVLVSWLIGLTVAIVVVAVIDLGEQWDAWPRFTGRFTRS
ncbi:MAG: phosphatase PAP2 family protein [Ilumatobacteraceae bacterium]